jgi:hypothetical protein
MKTYKAFSLFFFVMFILLCLCMILTSQERRADRINRELDLVESSRNKEYLDGFKRGYSDRVNYSIRQKTEYEKGWRDGVMKAYRDGN